MSPHDISRFHSRLVFRQAFLSFFLLAFSLPLAASPQDDLELVQPNYERQRFHKILVIGVAKTCEVRADFEDGRPDCASGHRTIPGNHILCARIQM